MSRIADFEALLTQNGIPFDGTSLTGSPPAGLTIQFRPEATPEQITLGNTLRDEFDWRPRRMIARNTLVNTLASLTVAQQNTILRHIAAAYIREHKPEALDVIATLGVNVPIDEVDPESP